KNQAVVTFDQSGLIGVTLPSPESADPVDGDQSHTPQEGFLLLTEQESQDIFANAVNHEGFDSNPEVTIFQDDSFTIGSVENTGLIQYGNEPIPPSENELPEGELSKNIEDGIHIIADKNVSIN